MKIVRLFSVIYLVLLACAMVGVVSGDYTTPESIVAADKVYVSGVTYDPAVFFPGDKGTLTIDVTNGNTATGVNVNHATVSSDTIRTTSSPYDSSSSLGPAQKQSFVYSVTADGLDGTYYPTFSLSFRDADSLYYRAVVKIDNTPLVLTILDKPDTFSQGAVKLVKRNKGTSAAIGVAAVVLLAVIAIAFVRVTSAMERAVSSERLAVANQKAAQAERQAAEEARDNQRKTALAASQELAGEAVGLGDLDGALGEGVGPDQPRRRLEPGHGLQAHPGTRRADRRRLQDGIPGRWNGCGP